VQALFQNVAGKEGYQVGIDLAAQTVTTPEETSYRFDIDPFRKDCLLKGLDSIGLTLQHETQVSSYEARRAAQAPWLFLDIQ
jgi:3-isopropylmalate/(R)-2-methylmalate dehydratase small subunit